MKNVAAVIITYNIGQRFHLTIESLENQVDKIVVVDNGSNEETIKMLEALGDKIILIKLNTNKGIAYALNRGIDYCIDNKFQWVITLDHDSILCDSMINEMLTQYDKLDESLKKEIAMIVPVHVEEKEYTENIDIKSGYKEVLTEITSGAMVKTDVYKNVGKYDEDLFIDSVDHDFCLFLNKKGFKIIQCNKAILKHNLGETERGKLLGIKDVAYSNHSPMRRYYIARNRMYLWKRYNNDFKDWIKIDKKTFLIEMVMILFCEKEKYKKLKMTYLGIKDYFKGNKGKFEN